MIEASQALRDARTRLLDELTIGKVRKIGELATEMGKPELSTHIDPRMRMTLRDVEQFYTPPQQKCENLRLVYQTGAGDAKQYS